MIKTLTIIIVSLLAISCSIIDDNSDETVSIERLELNTNILFFFDEVICTCITDYDSNSLTYNWTSDIDGLIDINSETIIFQPKNYIGNHILKCTITNDDGISAEKEISFEMKPPDGSDQFNLSDYFPLAINNNWIYGHYTPSTTALLQKKIVKKNEDLSFKMKEGVYNFPPGSYFFSDFKWEDDALFRYYEYEHMDRTIEIIKKFVLKKYAYHNEEWFTQEEDYASYHTINIVDSLVVSNEGWSFSFQQTFYDVALIDNTYYYARNVGFIGRKKNINNDISEEILDYEIFE
jgi:hypothetical protein